MAEAKGKTQIIDILDAHTKVRTSSPKEDAVKELVSSPLHLLTAKIVSQAKTEADLMANADFKNETTASAKTDFKAEDVDDVGSSEADEKFQENPPSCAIGPISADLDADKVLHFFSPRYCHHCLPAKLRPTSNYFIFLQQCQIDNLFLQEVAGGGSLGEGEACDDGSSFFGRNRASSLPQTSIPSKYIIYSILLLPNLNF